MATLWHTDFDPRELPADLFSGAKAMRNRLIAIFHGYFKQNPGKIAVYVDAKLPGIRVFALSMEDLIHFVESVRTHFFVRDYFAIGFPQSLDTDSFGGPWISLQGYNIRSIKQDSLTDAGVSRREARLAHANKNRWEYFIINSQSNGTRFSETVRPVKADGYTGFCPNSYGLARASMPFALPVLPSAATRAEVAGRGRKYG